MSRLESTVSSRREQTSFQVNAAELRYNRLYGWNTDHNSLRLQLDTVQPGPWLLTRMGGRRDVIPKGPVDLFAITTVSFPISNDCFANLLGALKTKVNGKCSLASLLGSREYTRVAETSVRV